MLASENASGVLSLKRDTEIAYVSSANNAHLNQLQPNVTTYISQQTHLYCYVHYNLSIVALENTQIFKSSYILYIVYKFCKLCESDTLYKN